MTHTAGYFHFQSNAEKLQSDLTAAGIQSKIIKKFGFGVLVSKADYRRAVEIRKGG